MDLLRKAMPLEVKDIDTKQGIFTGYFASFGTVDSYREIVDFGAFKKTFLDAGPAANRPRIKCAAQHDPFSGLLGKPLKLEEHPYGAYHETKVTPTSYGKDILLLIEDGVLTEQSFAFETIRDVPANKSPDGFRHLVEVKLWEYGPVTWGANPDTPITGVKASDLMGRMQKLDKHLKNGDLSDGSLVALLNQTMELWSNALQVVEPEPKEPEVIQVQTPTETPKADPEIGGSALEQKSMNGVWSFEETIDHVWQVVRMIERIPYAEGDGTYARYYLMETFPDLALMVDGTTGKYYTVPWVKNTEGAVVMGGDLTEVIKTYTPAQKAAAVAMLLRATTLTQAKSGKEEKAGARNSSADAAIIRDIHKMAKSLMDKPMQCKAMAEDMNEMTEDDMTMMMGLVDETHKAYILAALQPETEPSKSHSQSTTEVTPAPGPDPVHPDVQGKSVALLLRELELSAETTR